MFCIKTGGSLVHWLFINSTEAHASSESRQLYAYSSTCITISSVLSLSGLIQAYLYSLSYKKKIFLISLNSGTFSGWMALPGPSRPWPPRAVPGPRALRAHGEQPGAAAVARSRVNPRVCCVSPCRCDPWPCFANCRSAINHPVSVG